MKIADKRGRLLTEFIVEAICANEFLPVRCSQQIDEFALEFSAVFLDGSSCILAYNLHVPLMALRKRVLFESVCIAALFLAYLGLEVQLAYLSLVALLGFWPYLAEKLHHISLAIRTVRRNRKLTLNL